MKTLALGLAAALALAPLAPAVAADQSATVSFKVPGADKATSTKTTYTCLDQQVEVEYINAGPTSIALLTFKDEFVVAANVLAASGAKYAGDQYIWWAKGKDDATLTNLMTDSQTPVECKAKG
ncbi:MliC family protein [Amorphus coralli]|uniref:MliC family protein n=1 Tax=Amorphus coralli TaxID=340680 RepID=UPI0003826215|nr:MliC family protein [Amorphus coralli]